MGGNNYYCDYCDCYINSSIEARKTHNAGIKHVIAKNSHYRKYLGN